MFFGFLGLRLKRSKTSVATIVHLKHRMCFHETQRKQKRNVEAEVENAQCRSVSDHACESKNVHENVEELECQSGE